MGHFGRGGVFRPKKSAGFVVGVLSSEFHLILKEKPYKPTSLPWDRKLEPRARKST